MLCWRLMGSGSCLLIHDFCCFSGYVTVWDIEEYGQYPTVDLPDGAVCPCRSPPPRRITYWRAHIQPITCMELIEENDAIMTSSLDHTVRLWTTKGAFIGKMWTNLNLANWKHFLCGRMESVRNADKAPIVEMLLFKRLNMACNCRFF